MWRLLFFIGCLIWYGYLLCYAGRLLLYAIFCSFWSRQMTHGYEFIMQISCCQVRCSLAFMSPQLRCSSGRWFQMLIYLFHLCSFSRLIIFTLLAKSWAWNGDLLFMTWIKLEMLLVSILSFFWHVHFGASASMSRCMYAYIYRSFITAAA